MKQKSSRQDEADIFAKCLLHPDAKQRFSPNVCFGKPASEAGFSAQKRRSRHFLQMSASENRLRKQVFRRKNSEAEIFSKCLLPKTGLGPVGQLETTACSASNPQTAARQSSNAMFEPDDFFHFGVLSQIENYTRTDCLSRRTDCLENNTTENDSKNKTSRYQFTAPL